MILYIIMYRKEKRERIYFSTSTECRGSGSGKSGEPLLHRERPHIKSRSFLTNDFKNLKSVGVP
jgi:hypothetical protein